MCTSIVVNKKKTIVGWNLDIMDFEYRVRPTDDGVYIEINDATEGWMPLIGANRRGDFVGNHDQFSAFCPASVEAPMDGIGSLSKGRGTAQHGN